MKTAAELRQTLKNRLPLAYGVSGALATRLYSNADVERLIGVARAAGVSVFDTGPSYGAGLAEARLGQAIGKDPDAFIMTKAGLYSSGLAKRTRDFSPPTLTTSVQASLKRLQRETLDLLWLHGPSAAELTGDLFKTLEDLAAAGKVSAVGIATRDLSVLDAVPDGLSAAVMAPVNPDAPLPVLAGVKPVFFGIECLAGVRPQTGKSFNRNRLWSTARSLVRGAGSEQAPRTAQEAFAYAFEVADCDLVVSSSTQAARIQESSTICAQFKAGSHA